MPTIKVVISNVAQCVYTLKVKCIALILAKFHFSYAKK